MGRLELFLSEVSWHAGVLERMAWPSAQPSGFSTPSLLSLLYSHALLLSLSLSRSPLSLHLTGSHSPARRVVRASGASVCVSSPLTPPLSAVIRLVRRALTHFSTHPVIPLWRRTATSRGSSRLPFVAEIAWFAREFRPCAGLDDYRVIATRSVDDSSAAATS